MNSYLNQLNTIIIFKFVPRNTHNQRVIGMISKIYLTASLETIVTLKKIK